VCLSSLFGFLLCCFFSLSFLFSLLFPSSVGGCPGGALNNYQSVWVRCFCFGCDVHWLLPVLAVGPPSSKKHKFIPSVLSVFPSKIKNSPFIPNPLSNLKQPTYTLTCPLARPESYASCQKPKNIPSPPPFPRGLFLFFFCVCVWGWCFLSPPFSCSFCSSFFAFLVLWSPVGLGRVCPLWPPLHSFLVPDLNTGGFVVPFLGSLLAGWLWVLVSSSPFLCVGSLFLPGGFVCAWLSFAFWGGLVFGVTTTYLLWGSGPCPPPLNMFFLPPLQPTQLPFVLACRVWWRHQTSPVAGVLFSPSFLCCPGVSQRVCFGKLRPAAWGCNLKKNRPQNENPPG